MIPDDFMDQGLGQGSAGQLFCSRWCGQGHSAAFRWQVGWYGGSNLIVQVWLLGRDPWKAGLSSMDYFHGSSVSLERDSKNAQAWKLAQQGFAIMDH